MQYNVENELVHQKDHIRSLMNDEKFDEAIVLLNFTEELWAKCSYAYKTAELREIIKDKCRHNSLHATHWTQQAKWDRLAEKL